MKKYDPEEKVECTYQGVTIGIPVKLFASMTFRVGLDGKKFVRYKEGAYLYSVSEREFFDIAHEAEAVYKRNRMVLVKLELVDKYMEMFRERA